MMIRQAGIKISNTVTGHAFIFVSALGLALLVILPALVFPFIAGDSYRGINIGEWGDDANYIAKGREILEGHSPGNVFLNIGKDTSDPHQVYVEYLLLAPIQSLGLSRIATDHIVTLYYAYAVLGVFALILLIYFFVLRLSRHKLLSAAVALFTVGGYSMVRLYHVPITPTNPDPNMFSRPMMPLYGLLALFVYLNALTRGLASPSRKYVWWGGLAFGMLFYVYPYTWTFASAITGSLLVVYILLRDAERAKRVCAVMTLGIAIGAYTLFKTFSFASSDVGKQILYFGTETNYSPLPFSKLSFLVLILFVIFAYRNRKNGNIPLLLAIILGNWISLNQQVITGRAPQAFHYFWYFTIPLSIVLGAYLVWALAATERHGALALKKCGSVLLAVAILLAFGNTAFRGYRTTFAVMDTKQYAQGYRPIIDALNHVSQPSVILASDSFYARFLTVYTSHDLFWNSSAFAFNTPIERITDALYAYMYLDRGTRNNFSERLYNVNIGEGYGARGYRETENSDYPIIYTFLAEYWSGIDPTRYMSGFAAKDPAIMASRDRTIASLFNNYKKITADPRGITDILKRGGVGYIVWDANKNPEWDLSVLPGLKEITVSSNIHLYRIEWPEAAHADYRKPTI